MEVVIGLIFKQIFIFCLLSILLVADILPSNNYVFALESNDQVISGRVLRVAVLHVIDYFSVLCIIAIIILL